MKINLNELDTLLDFVRFGATRFNQAGCFYGHGTDNAWDDAMVLALHALHLPIETKPVILHSRLLKEEKQAIIDLFTQRIESRTPAAYLTKQAVFAGLGFYVDERVLIPRSPLAEIIEAEFDPWFNEPQRILDCCTGSACIAIASAIHCPYAEVVALDISTDALAVANINVERHQVENQVTLLESDVFSALGEERFDVIISNPPYVGDEEMATLPDEYRHEPELALRAANDGLAIVDTLLRQASHYLTDHGVLIVEVGNTAHFVEQHYTELPLTWLNFERGGHGVFVLTREQLVESFS